jgi:hypothetical protein
VKHWHIALPHRADTQPKQVNDPKQLQVTTDKLEEKKDENIC